MTKRIEMIGKKFGKLTVVALSEKRGNRGQLLYECLCDCGNKIIVMGESLRRGKTLSCTCEQKRRASEVNKTHGGSKERLYRVWQGIKDRCFNPSNTSFVHYGGRGITVCSEWMNYENFREFMLNQGYNEDSKWGEQTIERMDVNGNYEPSNCTIIPKNEQVYNRTSNHKLTYKGETKCLSEWAKKFNMCDSTLYNRLKRGYTIERALETPLKRPKVYEVNGECHTCREWATILNINYGTLKDKITKKKTTMDKEVYRIRGK